MVDLRQLQGNRHYQIWRRARVMQTHDTSSRMMLVRIKLPLHHSRNRFKLVQLICTAFGHVSSSCNTSYLIWHILNQILMSLNHSWRPSMQDIFFSQPSNLCGVFSLLFSYVNFKFKTSVLDVEYNTRIVAYLETTSPSCSHMLLPCLCRLEECFLLWSHSWKPCVSRLLWAPGAGVTMIVTKVTIYHCLAMVCVCMAVFLRF